MDRGACQATVHGVTRVGHDRVTKQQQKESFPGGSDGKASACNAKDLGQEDPLEAMAIHSSTLAWTIQWTEEPARLQSMGSQELDTTE